MAWYKNIKEQGARWMKGIQGEAKKKKDLLGSKGHKIVLFVARYPVSYNEAEH